MYNDYIKLCLEKIDKLKQLKIACHAEFSEYDYILVDNKTNEIKHVDKNVFNRDVSGKTIHKTKKHLDRLKTKVTFSDLDKQSEV